MVAVLQLPLLTQEDGRRQRLITGVQANQCRISRFNTRKERTPEQVKALAERMLRNGFELTRALWVYEANDGKYEVFAGGTRLQAAQLASVAVAVVLHEDYTWEEISRLSDQDNENDEYHAPVRPMDVWAEYARLRDEEGWTGKTIAAAKNVHPTTVGERIKWHELPPEIKRQVGNSENTTTTLTERHLREVFGEIQQVVFFATWADIPAWRVELLETAITKKWSSRQLGERWQERKAAVERANVLLDKLPDGEADEYLTDGDTITRAAVDWRLVFADQLQTTAACVPADVDVAFNAVAERMQVSHTRKEAFDNKQSAAELETQEEAAHIEAINARWHNDDCLDLLVTIPDGTIKLLLTDPPYGIDFQSNHRVASGKADKIANDGNLDAALDVFGKMLDALAPKLADEAHLLVFTNWQVEPAFRAALEARGYDMRGSLVWVKENHTSGDLNGSFAPRHERILHAAKGRPAVSPRADDVLQAKRETATDHPTEKPTALLKQLIDCTTKRGELVVDPFAGTGATCVAAKELEREYWGCEMDNHYWQQGFERLR